MTLKENSVEMLKFSFIEHWSHCYTRVKRNVRSIATSVNDGYIDFFSSFEINICNIGYLYGNLGTWVILNFWSLLFHVHLHLNILWSIHSCIPNTLTQKWKCMNKYFNLIILPIVNMYLLHCLVFNTLN